ncbi:MAG: phage tail length tape measure family protein [Sphingomonas phyllosphaerae]
MDEDGSPGFGVGFDIDFGDSFGGLKTLDDLIGSTAANAVREFQRIQGAVMSGTDLKRAADEFRSLGRETRSAAQDFARVEREAESLVRQLERQNATFGMSRQELQSLKIATAAKAAEDRGMVELVGRLRTEEALLNDQRAKAAAATAAEAQATREAAQAYHMFETAARKGAEAMREAAAAEKAMEAERHAQEIRSAAFAFQQFETRAREGARAMREADAAARALALEQTAQEARSAALGFQLFETHARQMAQAARDAAQAEATLAREAAAVRASLDPMFAAQRRFDDEMDRADRLLAAGAIRQHEYAAETNRAREALAAHARQVAGTGDVVATGSKKFAASVDEVEKSVRRQGFAVQQLALQSPDIIQGLLTGQKPLTVLIQQGGQLVQVAMMAQGGIRGFAAEIGMFALRFAPLIGLVGAATAGFALFNRWINQGVTNDDLTRDLGKITGGANATKAELFKLKDETVTWADTSKAMFEVVGKDVMAVFVSDVKSMGKDVKTLLDDLTSYGRQALAGLYAGVAGMKSYLGELEKGGFTGLAKTLVGQGDPKLLEKTFGASYDAADKYLTKLGGRIRKAAVDNARDRLADKIGFNAPTPPKVDRHAEQLARQAAAEEAQIAGQYKIAAAYRVSGAAALIAEAEVKAETAAILKRGEAEAFISRQIRLAVAQRVSDSARTSAAMREQAAQQQLVNDDVAAGVIPAERAAELLKDRMADLPLLAALEAARTIKGKEGTRAVEEANKALADSRAARDALTDAERRAALQAAQGGANDRLEQLQEEIRLIGATDTARARSMAILTATQEAARRQWTGPDAAKYIETQAKIAEGEVQRQLLTDALNNSLNHQSELLDGIATNVTNAARGMADAFGDVGRAIGDTAAIFAQFRADQQRLTDVYRQQLKIANQLPAGEAKTAALRRANAQYEVRTATAQIGLYGDMTSAAKGLFDEKSRGYAALMAAEKVYRAFEFAMSVRAMVQDVSETISSVANSGARAAANGAEGVSAQAKLPFPFNMAAMAATAAALVAAGVTIFSSRSSGASAPVTNTGTGTVLGDPAKQSESLKRSVDNLAGIESATSVYTREMLASLRSIEGAIGGVAAQIVRAGNVDASAGVTEGFQKNLIGSVLSKIPLIGGILGGLFGSKTEVTGSGLYAKDQTLESILSRGFDASYYSDVKKTSSFLGIKTGSKTSTQYTGASGELEGQFTLILRQFNDAIASAAGPLGQSTDEIQRRLNGFVLNLGKVDLKGLTGEQIEEKLNAVFGAAADNMAAAAFPGLSRFQKAGEGAFETLTRVASTVEAVTTALDLLGGSSRVLGIDMKVALADQFDSVSDFTGAVQAYADAYYTQEEKQAAQAAQMNRVFASLGLTVPQTLAGFRQLVEAQDLTTAAGRSTYAALLNLAPAFADLKTAMDGAKSAADVLAERQDLERQLLELSGNTAAIRALDLAKLDASNRALQEQIWSVKDAQDAAKAAKELRDAWKSVGDTIMDEVNRIRGLNEADTAGGFAAIMSRFNIASDAARGGDQDAAKTLPQISQALLAAAANAATSKQELDRVKVQTAASLEATYAAISIFAASAGGPGTAANDQLSASSAASEAASASQLSEDTLAETLAQLLEETVGMRRDNNTGHAATASNTGRIAKTLDAVTQAGDAISITQAAA